MYNFRINTISDPLISKCNPVVVCKFCGRPGHTKRSCSAISKGTEDEIFIRVLWLDLISRRALRLMQNLNRLQRMKLRYGFQF